MKKFLSLLLISMLSMFSLTACDDSGENGNTTPPPAPIDPEQFIGTYNVDFFASISDTGLMGILIFTNDCAEAIKRGLASADEGKDGKPVCSEPSAESSGSVVTLYGKTVTLSKDSAGNYVVESKIQMGNDFMNKVSNTDMYQYTKYTPMPANVFTVIGVNNWDNAVKGVSGRNLDTASNNPKSTFQFTMEEDGRILHKLLIKDKMTLIGPKDAETVLVLSKVSKDVQKIEPNSLFTTSTGNPTYDDTFKLFKKEPNPAQ